MKNKINIFWFRRDLRIEDNHGLYRALLSANNVLPIFIFDTEILDKLENKQDRRVDFIHREVEKLKSKFEKSGSSLFVFYGKPIDAFKNILEKHSIEKVFTNHDYEPYGINRDKINEDFLESKNIKFESYKDIVYFEKGEILKDDNTPYTVYTPYSKKWQAKFINTKLEFYPSEKFLDKLLKTTPLPFPKIEDIGFQKTQTDFPAKEINESIIRNYSETRDFPAINGTSKLSLHLRFGTVSIRKLIDFASKNSEKWFNELIWREFYQMILFHFPNVINSAFKKEYNNIEWENDEEHFQKWCEGKTGYPIVDAGMRELNETGYMHNRVRMIVSSFLTKDLLIDWRWGEAYFAEKLLDFELASNNGGWQWAAGCGVDAAPYFRVFNPTIQALKFDPKFEYIKKWVPEYDKLEYPKPIVNHDIAKKRVIERYQKAVSKKLILN